MSELLFRTLPQFQIKFDPLPLPGAVVQGPNVRFTVLTTRLIRMEYSPADVFEDRPSQAFWYRRQPLPAFQVVQDDSHIEIITEHLHLRYQVTPKGFTPRSLSVLVKTTGQQWRFGDRYWRSGNLRGTARTLDGTSGRAEMEPGLMSRSGWAVVDDSQSLVFNDDCWLENRTNPETGLPSRNLDLYFFGYGHAYPDCLKDYCKLTGKTPMLPRYILGNWWSRYWAYTQAELTGLMQEFKQHDIPLSVCIVDMDWHLTEPGEAWSGWTGYTWNRKLFPDPQGLIDWLHSQGLKTALNLHPAEGVNPHEAQYEEMAKFMGVDPASKEGIPFDIANPQFVEAYFNLLHHPYEDMGVDFWWMDWQQGKQSKMAGLDPLWWLNHLHFYDLGRTGTKRPFVFSRWGGLGNHRYPIGFSGDTVVSWDSLVLQPNFTATAANVNYGWWSHDIGGHMGGVEDDELYLRWMQYGVFSPILRMHCTKNPYHERRPWARGAGVAQAASRALRLRHALIPYIYSMAWRNHTADLPFITPMYYSHPAEEDAYHCPNQYWYGSELIAAPFIEPLIIDLGMSRQRVWLPEGDWFDFWQAISSTTSELLFRSETLPGGWRTVYGSLEDVPVYAKAGAIVPLAPQVGWGGIDNPHELNIHVFPGADNAFDLYEDDGETTLYLQGHYAITHMEQKWNDPQLRFTIAPASGDLSLIPANRSFKLSFHGIKIPDQVEILVNGSPLVKSDPAGTIFDNQGTPWIEIIMKPTDELVVILSSSADSLLDKTDHRLEHIRKMLQSFRLNTNVKHRIDQALPRLMSGELPLYRFPELTESQMNALAHALKGGKGVI